MSKQARIVLGLALFVLVVIGAAMLGYSTGKAIAEYDNAQAEPEN